MTDFKALFTCFADSGIDVIVIGGVAARAHGSARFTEDLDVVYLRTPENIRRMVRALDSHSPYLRGAPPGLPFRWDERTITRGLNFTLITDLGAIDLIGEVTGGGHYEDLIEHTVSAELFGHSYRCLDLDWLIRVKRAAGRPKDLEALAELEVIRDAKMPHPPTAGEFAK
ncbi:MAG TPA: hypothetical protein VLI90_02740 [Tepidisphaeraceae bacterium]|nr:hypothetical protein [Tepidisphaeraceae bacterium]